MTQPLEPFPQATPDEPAPPRAARYGRGTKKRRTPVMVVVVIAILLLGAAGAGAYWRLGYKHKTASQPQQDTTASTPNTPASPTPPPVSADTQQYTSNGQDLNLSFSYPVNWTVQPASGHNSNDQPITVTSPQAAITDSTGKSVAGKVVVSIRPGNAQISELSSDTAVVAQDSMQIGYTKPTASQHQYPYLTFVRLNGKADAANGFDEVIITGISKFTKGQSLSAESLGQLDPIISARFYACAASCDGPSATALAIAPDTWQNDAPFIQVLALFQSLQLR